MPTRLERAIGRWDLVALTINAVIGAGIFGLPSRAYALIGPFSLIAFLACAVIATTIVLCFAEVGSRFSKTGGSYLYAREAFGPWTGFTVGWLVWVTRITSYAANTNLLVSYGSYFLPAIGSGWGRAATITLLTLTLAALNILGIRQTTRTSNIASAGKLLALFSFALLGLFFIQGSRLALPALPAYRDFSLAVLLLVYAFTGFEMAVIPGGEIENPRRNIPLGLLTAIAIIVCCYVLIQLVCIGTLPGLAHSERPLADASRQFLGPAGGAFITAGALVSILGNLNIVVLTASRLPFAMGEQRELPTWLARTSRFRTPHWAILITAATMLAATLSGTFVYAVTVSTLARLVGYFVTIAALVVFRRQPAAPPAGFLLRGGPMIAGIALILIAWLLSSSTAREARDTAIVLAAGWLLRYLYRWQAEAKLKPLPPAREF